MATAERPPPRPRSWAPALLVGHVVLGAGAAAVSLVLLALGADEEWPGHRVVGVVVGLLVVGAAGRRHGPRPQARGGRWAAVAGLVVLGVWVWSAVWLAGLSGPTAPLLAVLPLYLWPFALLAVVAAGVVACLDLAVGEVLHRRRG
ncbi:hypothetical protein SAMN05660199_02002 [Klenkia soli]|uniref:Uncharacterized protein n=1 Tax=Klenkia soli TaxID=1052260 RepID=A0A1H0JK85_9ACTN|nr:hypothetical protein [Klenkia soli]SDO44188.1 hypothetical protein SAMN05660199_02002 [Klenkia soli]